MTLVQPTPEMSLRIQKDLNEEPSKNEESLQHIKEWLEKQPHLPQVDDDQRLITFLRGCKFSLEKTKRKLDMYYTMRTALPEFFANRDPMRPEIQEVFKNIQMPPLPGLTPEGRRVVVMRASGNELGTVSEDFKAALMVGDIRLKEEAVGVAGDVYILDATVATASQFSKVTPLLIKKFLVCVQEAYPVKLKEVHVVNVSPLVDSIVSFVKPFLKEKIRERIHIHSDGLDSLYKFVPKEMLPEEYGGNAGPISEINEQWRKKLESYKDWFLEQENVKADESKRQGKTRSYDDLFGVDGSFRKLTID
ncbi:alpha-tocopherol transfer protein-like [Ischnura elegans]|uniref:alpha-tocopherol transfer protein-like n=1 Tax=Ischnura elegans TaxID=197161 RepID=UPI001ED899D5|nr:alpha-tocopherol transfer protein-like [Ischnura elegans]